MRTIDQTNLTKNSIRYINGVYAPTIMYFCIRVMSIEPFSSGKKSHKTQYNSYKTNIPTYTEIMVVLSTEFNITDPKTFIMKYIDTKSDMNCNLLSPKNPDTVDGTISRANLSIILNTHNVYLKKKWNIGLFCFIFVRDNSNVFTLSPFSFVKYITKNQLYTT